MRDASFAHDAREVLVLRETLIVPPGGENVMIPLIAIEVPAIGETRQVMRGQVEVDVLVVVAAEEAGEVEGAAHGEESGDAIGVTQRNVDGMEAAKAASQGGEAQIGRA